MNIWWYFQVWKSKSILYPTKSDKWRMTILFWNLTFKDVISPPSRLHKRILSLKVTTFVVCHPPLGTHFRRLESHQKMISWSDWGAHFLFGLYTSERSPSRAISVAIRLFMTRRIRRREKQWLALKGYGSFMSAWKQFSCTSQSRYRQLWSGYISFFVCSVFCSEQLKS